MTVHVRFGEPDVTAPQANSGNYGVLTQMISEAVPGVPVKQARVLLAAVLGSVEAILRDRKKLVLKGFGTFERRVRKGRPYQHPATGEKMVIPDKVTVVFKPSDGLLASIARRRE